MTSCLKLRRFLACVLMTIAMATPLAAQAEITGEWWVDLGTTPAADLARMSYVNGLMSGAGLFGPVMAIMDKLDPEALSVGTRYMVIIQTYLSRVDTKQVVTGMDAFFADYRNKRIRVATAAMVVVSDICGMPRAEIEKWIEDLRSGARQ